MRVVTGVRDGKHGERWRVGLGRTMGRVEGVRDFQHRARRHAAGTEAVVKNGVRPVERKRDFSPTGTG